MTTPPTDRSARSHPLALSRLWRWSRSRSRSTTISILLGSLLAIGSILGVRAQALGPAGPSPAQGHASVIAHGIVQAPDSVARWRIFTERTASGGEARTFATSSFVFAAGNPLLISEASTGYRQRLAAGEGMFVNSGQTVAIEPFGAPEDFYVIEVGPGNASLPAPALFVSDGFKADGLDHDLSLLRDVLAENEEGKIPGGATPTLILVLNGSLNVEPRGESAQTLPAGRAGIFEGELALSGQAAGTTYIAAHLGATIPFASTPVVTQTPLASPTVQATPVPPKTPTPVPAQVATPTPTAATPAATRAATPTSTPASTADDDNDGLTNVEEAALGTDPANPDSDDDGVSDGDEVNGYRTDPLNLDTDGDTLYDGGELVYGTGILVPDTDGDGLPDGDEVYIYLTSPTSADTDGDGISDGVEVRDGTDPLQAPSAAPTSVPSARVPPSVSPTSAPPSAAPVSAGEAGQAGQGTGDSDGDGLTNAQEARFGTNPAIGDSDGDSVNDSNEVAAGTNPLDPTSYP